MQLKAGEEIGAFVVEGLLGMGGMAEVWAVRHSLLGSRHALKVFFEASPRIHREARAMSEVVHDNLLSIEELLTIGDRPALLMPLIDGPTLEGLLRIRPLSEQESLAMVTDITRGLVAAHDAGLVHRDLKPANILIDITADGLVPKIMDFGLVKVDDDDIETRAGMAMGTPAYAAPEQLLDARLADTRSDLWSMGVILCELLCGQRPPPTPGPLPESVRPLIEALLSTEPAERPSSAQALLDALLPLVVSEPLSADGPLAVAIRQRIPPTTPSADSMDSLWTWGAGTADETSEASTIAQPPKPPPEVEGTPWTERYVLERELGRGGMAVVWRAWDHRLGAWRAIKILQPQLSSTGIRRRFELEARTMARLAHDSIVTIHDISEHEGQLFIVMEWLTGGALSERIRGDGPLSPRQSVTMMIAILGALHAAHAAGIVHRDVKPGNILLDAKGRPVLTDFGIARVGSTDASLTRTGMALGTLTYMAPEQRIDARSVDHRADLYAAGATLWTALTARAPLMFVAPESDEELFATVLEPLAQIIHTATRYRPADRYADAAAMAEALSAVMPLLPQDGPDTLPLLVGDLDAALPAISTGPVSDGEETWSGVGTDLLTEPPVLPVPLAVSEPLPAPVVQAPVAPAPSRWWLPAGVLVLAGTVGIAVGPSLLEAPVVEPITEPLVEPITEPIAEPVEVRTEAPPEEPLVEPVTEPVEVIEPIERPPEPVAVVEPVELDPVEPDPIEPEVPAVAPTARITVTGDSESIQLIDAAGTVHAPGALPPGEYTLRVWFAERLASGVASITVAEGEHVTFSCTNKFSMCSKQGG
ncbi:MAG: serine/threonine protein kinase [Myxococcota bacterium]